MFMRILLFVLAFLPATGQAQDIIFTPDATVSCLHDATDQAARKACIGASANTCMEATPDGSTTYGMSVCLRAEHAFWDTRLNASYQDAVVSATETDAAMIASDIDVPSIAQSLKDMQRAWIPFRDAACAYEVAQWSNGSGRGPARWACLMHMTATQTLLIEGPDL